MVATGRATAENVVTASSREAAGPRASTINSRGSAKGSSPTQDVKLRSLIGPRGKCGDATVSSKNSFGKNRAADRARYTTMYSETFRPSGSPARSTMAVTVLTTPDRSLAYAVAQTSAQRRRPRRLVRLLPQPDLVDNPGADRPVLTRLAVPDKTLTSGPCCRTATSSAETRSGSLTAWCSRWRALPTAGRSELGPRLALRAPSRLLGRLQVVVATAPTAFLRDPGKARCTAGVPIVLPVQSPVVPLDGPPTAPVAARGIRLRVDVQ